MSKLARSAFLALAATGCLFRSHLVWTRVDIVEPPGPAPHRNSIVDSDGYDAFIDVHERPYVFEAQVGDGAVLVFGAEHTQEPDDPQVASIERRWDAFQPTFALVESRLGTMFPLLMDPVRTFGEPGAVLALAKRDGVKLRSWEPPAEALVRKMLDAGQTEEQIALRFYLNPYFSTLRHGRPDDPEAFVLDTLGDRDRAPGVHDVLRTIDEVDAAWQAEFPDGPDWRDVSDQFGLPGALGECDVSLLRDQHLVDVVWDLASYGERVFVVCGSSHSVKVEPALVLESR